MYHKEASHQSNVSDHKKSRRAIKILYEEHGAAHLQGRPQQLTLFSLKLERPSDSADPRQGQIPYFTMLTKSKN